MKNGMMDLSKQTTASPIPQGLETDDQDAEEGIDFLQREQNRNML
jgi:hypothetical protein